MSLGPIMVDVAGRSLLPEDKNLLRHPWVGGVILFARNFSHIQQLCQLVEEIKRLRHPALLVAVDHEGGRVQRFRDGFTHIPAMHQLGHLYDIDPAQARALAKDIGWLMGAELNAVGVDLCFAPVVDLGSGLSEVIGDRAFHADAKVVARLALDLAMGLRDAGMAATAKHFPGHGGVVLDSHVAQPVDRRDWWDLDADMYPFRTLLNNGVHSVMTSHVVYSQVDALPASLSPVWIKRILREDMRFQGAVMTDDLSMAGAQAFGGIEQRVQLALEAGADLLLICNHRESVERALAVERGAIPAASALRLARLRAKRLNAEFATMELLNQHPRVMAIRERIVALINRAPDLKLEG